MCTLYLFSHGRLCPVLSAGVEVFGTGAVKAHRSSLHAAAAVDLLTGGCGEQEAAHDLNENEARFHVKLKYNLEKTCADSYYICRLKFHVVY